jgi:MFS family permease
LIWRQGVGLALGSVGFGSIISFIALYYASQHWDGAGATLSAFGFAYILARLIGGNLPDKIGGTKIAVASLTVETAGLLLVAAASPMLAMGGAFLTGAGFALVFPSLGVVAVRRVPAANRGSALGGYVAFFDIGLAISGPIAGFIAASYGYPAIFVVGAGAAILAMVFAKP